MDIWEEDLCIKGLNGDYTHEYGGNDPTDSSSTYDQVREKTQSLDLSFYPVIYQSGYAHVASHPKCH